MSAYNDGGLAQRGEAWLMVAQALNWYAPWWINGEGTGRENAVAAIKKMAKAYGTTQPAPEVDDTRMARALEWVRAECGFYNNAEARTHLPAIEEAIAAYGPNCGARTVRVVDGEVRFNAAFFVNNAGNRIEQLTTYEDYRRDGAVLALMDLGQKRASAKKLTKKGGGRVVLAWVSAPQPILEDDGSPFARAQEVQP